MCVLGPSQVLEPRRHACVQELFFGASAEDVLTLLGAPSRVFYKVQFIISCILWVFKLIGEDLIERMKTK